MFIISDTNPARFIDVNNINDSFDGDFAIKQVLSYQTPKCYFQKWQRNDIIKLQVLSDIEPTQVEFRDIYTDLIIATSDWAEKVTAIVGQTFKAYEIEFPLISLEGKYYMQFTYEDIDTHLTHLLISEPICVQVSHENTMLLKYKNSINDFDIIFETDIEFQFRVESAIKNYTPGNDRATYIDQKHNPTLLSAIPYRKLKFFVGFQQGVPVWVMDKVNRIQSVDQVSYNAVYYQIPKDAEYEVELNDSNDFTGGSIDVQPIDNNFNRYIIENVVSDNIFAPMQKRLRYFNVGADFSIPGVFNSFSLLEKLVITKRSAPEINLNIGITPNGTEIGKFTVDDSRFVQTIEWNFSNSQTAYLSGLSGSDCDIIILYKQLDVDDIDLGTGVTPPPNLGNNAVIIYHGTESQLNIDFDVATGIGRANTLWFGWIICDGRNEVDSLDMRGYAPVGYLSGDPDFGDIGVAVGEKTHKLIIDEMPRHNHPNVLPTRKFKLESGAGPDVSRDGGDQRDFPGAVQFTGGDLPHNNIQPSKPLIFVKKIS